MVVDPSNQQPQAPKTVTLPPTRAALTWDRATDALVAAAEDAEAKAKDEYETAKARYQEARQHAHMIRQLRAIARVDGQSMAAVIREAKPTRWSRKHDACVSCGRTDSKHASGGYCDRCVKAGRNQEAQAND